MEAATSLVPDFLWAYFDELDEHPWLFSAVASVLVGLSGVFPMLVIPIDKTESFNDGAGAATLRMLLSFAVGGLLGDVFLHLLPEAWEYDIRNTKEGEHVSMKCGLWVLCGMLVFIVVEKLFAVPEEHEEPKKEHLEIEELYKILNTDKKKKATGAGKKEMRNGSVPEDAGSCLFNNNTLGEPGPCENGCGGAGAAEGGARCVKTGRWMGRCLLREAREAAARRDPPAHAKHVAGYLNLMANSIDNFTHGLAVGGSFLIGFRVGVLTTFAILVHEIPHEVGDFAILLRSGFTRWEAAKAQMATATAGLVGAMTAVIFSGARNAIEAKTSWIAPFTAGGFLHIALVTVLPTLLQEKDKVESLKHLSALVLGIAVMAAATHYCG